MLDQQWRPAQPGATRTDFELSTVPRTASAGQIIDARTTTSRTSSRRQVRRRRRRSPGPINHGSIDGYFVALVRILRSMSFAITSRSSAFPKGMIKSSSSCGPPPWAPSADIGGNTQARRPRGQDSPPAHLHKPQCLPRDCSLGVWVVSPCQKSITLSRHRRRRYSRDTWRSRRRHSDDCRDSLAEAVDHECEA